MPVRDDPNWKTVFAYTEPEAGRLTLEGDFDGRRTQAVLRRAHESESLLTTRGFHWVNEYPFNR